MSLKAQLDACRRAFEVNSEAHVVAALQRCIAELTEMGLASQAVKAGNMAPPFGLPSGSGGFFSLSDRLDRGPVVISFIRGIWCPFCTLELQALSQVQAEIKRLGATVIALSPHVRGRSECLGRDGSPTFPLLWDRGCRIATRYRIAFTVPEKFRAAYLSFGYGNWSKTVSGSWVLPLPATYVIDSNGLVVISYVDPDFTTRLDPAEVVTALAHLGARTNATLSGSFN
jgi:peroxiredoxin